MRRRHKLVGLIVVALAGIAGYRYWDQAPRRWAERITGLDLPAMKVVYDVSPAVDPAAQGVTRILQFKDRDDAEAFIDCRFPGWRKDERDLTVRLDLLVTDVPLREQNCYRQLADGRGIGMTMVFFGDVLLIKTTR